MLLFILLAYPVVPATVQALTGLPATAATVDRLAARAIPFDGPAAPVAPAVINRDAKGDATIRAIRIDRPPDAGQRAAHSLSTSVRLNWEYQPSSQFFLVYSDGRDTLGPGVPELLNRSFAAKITRLLRF